MFVFSWDGMKFCRDTDAHPIAAHTAYLYLHAIQRGNQSVVNGFLRSPPRQHLPSIQGEELVRVKVRLIGIVGRLNDAIPFLGQAAHRPHHADTVAEIQIGGGFIHDKDFSLLRDGAGDQGKLPLPAADTSVAAMLQMRNSELFKGLLRLQNLRFARGGKRPCLGRRSHQYHVKYAEVKHRMVRLRDIGNMARQFFRTHGRNRHIFNTRLAARWRQQSQHTAEQRAFSHAVRAKHRQKFAVFRTEADIS